MAPSNTPHATPAPASSEYLASAQDLHALTRQVQDSLRSINELRRILGAPPLDLTDTPAPAREAR